jgi:hypothetical protein
MGDLIVHHSYSDAFPMTTQASVLDKIVHEWHMSQTEMQLLSGKWVCFYLSNDLHSFTTRLSPNCPAERRR